MQHNKARCILVLGLHMVLSASPCTVLSLQIVTGMLPDSQDLSFDSPAHEWPARQRNATCSTAVWPKVPTPREALNFFLLIIREVLFVFAPSAGDREHCLWGRFQRLLSSSHGWQLLSNVTIFGPQGSEALRRRAGKRKRGQRRNKRAGRWQWFSVCRWCRFPSVWLPNGVSAHSSFHASVLTPCLLPHGWTLHWPLTPRPTRVTADP